MSTADTRTAPARAHLRQRPGSALAAVLSLTRVSLLSFLREPITLVFGLVYPLFMLLLFTAVFPGKEGGVSYGAFLMPAMITTSLLMTCTQILSITIAGERESGALKRMALLPVPSWAHVVSKTLVNIVIVLFNTVVLILVGWLLVDVRPPTTPSAWGLLLLTFVLSIGAFTSLGLAVGRMCPSSRAASGITTPVVLVLQFVSGLFLPLSKLPTWVVDIFSVLPVRWAGELMREVFLPASFSATEPTGAWETGKGLVVVAAWFVGGALLAILLARRDTVDR